MLKIWMEGGDDEENMQTRTYMMHTRVSEAFNTNWVLSWNKKIKYKNKTYRLA